MEPYHRLQLFLHKWNDLNNRLSVTLHTKYIHTDCFITGISIFSCKRIVDILLRATAYYMHINLTL